MEASILRLQVCLIDSAVLFDFAMHRVRRVQFVGTSVAVLLLVASQRTSAQHSNEYVGSHTQQLLSPASSSGNCQTDVC